MSCKCERGHTHTRSVHSNQSNIGYNIRFQNIFIFVGRGSSVPSGRRTAAPVADHRVDTPAKTKHCVHKRVPFSPHVRRSSRRGSLVVVLVRCVLFHVIYFVHTSRALVREPCAVGSGTGANVFPKTSGGPGAGGPRIYFEQGGGGRAKAFRKHVNKYQVMMLNNNCIDLFCYTIDA